MEAVYILQYEGWHAILAQFRDDTCLIRDDKYLGKLRVSDITVRPRLLRDVYP